jgi:glucokinase
MMNTTAPLALGIDIGGTNTKMGLVNPAGEITSFQKFPTNAHGDDPEPFFRQLFQQIDEILTAAEHTVLGIGVSTHGEVDIEHRGPIISANTPALRGVDIRGRLEERYPLPIILNNDLTAHALGEYHFGCGHGIGRFMCMAIGTGLGAAVIVNGDPIIIDGGNSGNTGLIILDPDGAVDSNGIKGSAEALCGVPGIEQLAVERYGRQVPAHEVIAAARTGDDPIATGIMQQIGSYLGQTLASLSVIFYPHRIALTGGTASAGDVLLKACQDKFDTLVGDFFRKISRSTEGYFQDVEIVLGENKGETGIVGAVVEILKPYFQA